MSTRKERRQSRRVPTDFVLEVEALDGSRVPARALNLSAGGAYLLVERPLAPLAKLAVELELPAVGEGEEGGRRTWRLRADAVVVRAEEQGAEYRIGLAFMHMRPADRTRLEDYIEWRLTRSLLESAEGAGE